MDKKQEKEIEYLNLHLNRLWTGLIVLIGGLAGLLLTYSYSSPPSSPENIVKILLLIIGLFLFILMSIGLTNVSSEIKRLLK
ncbi:MAG: hypothetical protein PHC64_10010 [Candidatus Gastranaerophilales bacterium]|nr:hypothetical protein [Candidatus Gastranaerophilales bacterium]